ncbi:MAG: DegT/DnrJ/EryC1/StrS family aminotransferase, partial [Chloroflexota bacterium]
FSFYPTKVMTSGEGGIITTDDEWLYQRAQTFRDQGKAGFLTNLHTELGYNWRMSEVHAVIGLAQFRRLEEFIQRRRHIAAIYDRGLAGMEGLRPLKVPEGSDTNYYKYVAFLPPGVDRAQLKREVKEKYGVGLSGEVYELPCHLQPVFEGLAPRGSLPVSEDLCQRMVCLPLYATMTDEEAAYVVDSLKAVLG